MSRPSRARGLKLAKVKPSSRPIKVAPFAGAWIETSKSYVINIIATSRPSRARGLKHLNIAGVSVPVDVAPFAGAWIET